MSIVQRAVSSRTTRHFTSHADGPDRRDQTGSSNAVVNRCDDPSRGDPCASGQRILPLPRPLSAIHDASTVISPM